jgi:3-oxoadipate enol-lactonase
MGMKSIEVHHEITGPPDAPVLVLAGPLGGTLQIWDPQVEALAGRFRVLRYDHRGHGGSPVPDGPYAMAELGIDALALLDRLGIERATFCGLSLGGMAGIWLGAHAPERVSSLVLCSTSAYFEDSGPWQERAAVVRWTSTSSIASTVVERWFTPRWAAQHQEVVTRATQMISETSDEGYSACCGAIAAWDGRKLLGRISAPTLVIAGKHDPATPMTPHAQTILTGIFGAKLEVLDAAHAVNLEQDKQVNDLITEHAAGQ